MSGGLKPGGATSGLPAGGTSADVLTGDGAWTAGSDVLHDGLATFTGSVAGRVIVGDGAGGVQPTSSAVSALLASADAAAIAAAAGVSAPPAVTSITFTDIGSKQFRIDVQTRVGGVLQPCVMTHLRLTYLPLDPAQFGLAAGIQQENISPYYGGGDICVSSYMRWLRIKLYMPSISFWR